MSPLAASGAFPFMQTLADDVSASASGDLAAFERLVEKTKRAVTTIALGIVRDVRVSEDVAQEVFVDVWRDLRTLKNVGCFLPWMRQLTRNKALTLARGMRRYDKRHAAWDAAGADVAAPTASVLERAISEEEALVMSEAIEALPDETREVLTLFYREDRSIRQVATLLGLSEAVVKKRLERARLAVKTEVLDRYGELSRRTMPAAAFTAGVVASISLASTTAAAATTSLTAKTTGSAALGSAALPVAGFIASLGAWYWAMNRSVRDAINEEERRAVIRHRTKGLLVIGGLLVTLPVVVGLGTGLLHSRVARLSAVFAMVVTLSSAIVYLCLTGPVAVIARRQRKVSSHPAVTIAVGAVSTVLGLTLAYFIITRHH